MFEENKFSDSKPSSLTSPENYPPNNEKDIDSFMKEVYKDILKKFLDGKSPEEKEKIIVALIYNLQEDLMALSDKEK